MALYSSRPPGLLRSLLAGATAWSALLIPLAFLLPVESAPYSSLDRRTYQSAEMESLVSVVRLVPSVLHPS